ALPYIPAADVIGFRDASARKPFTLLGADSVRSLFALDCIASAVQELRAEGFQVDVRSGCTWAHVPQWPMSALLIRGVFRSVYLWEGACRETDAVLFREAFGMREAAAVAPVHPAAPSAFDVRGSPQLELRSTAIDMVAATVSACYNALPEHGVLRESIRYCLHKSIADPILENLKSGGLVSSSTIQRYFVVFDAALLLADQMRFATNPPPAEYMLSDSSPLLGTDWLLTETFECSDPGRAWEITQQLMYHRGDARLSLSGDLQPDEMDPEDFQHYDAAARKVRALSQELAAIWGHNMLTAVGLGSQATGVMDKMHAIVHSFRLSSRTMLSCQQRAQRILSVTTDMGTEAGLSSARAVDMMDVFPHWFDFNVVPDGGGGEAMDVYQEGCPTATPAFEITVDDGRASPDHTDIGGVAFGTTCDDGAVPRGPADVGSGGAAFAVVRDDGTAAADAATAGPETHAGGEGDAPTAFVVEPDGGGGATLDIAHVDAPKVADPRGGAPGAGTTRDRAFFHGSLQVAGVLHITNNALQDALKAFTHMEWYLKRAKPLILLLCDRFTKERLIERCFKAPEAEGHQKALREMRTKPTEWRFGSWVPALQQMQFIEAGMRAHWDLRKYNVRPGDNRPARLDADMGESRAQRPPAEDGGDVAEADLHLIDEAVRDPKFWVYGHAILCAVHGCLYELQNYMESCPCHAVDCREKDGFAAGRPYFRRRAEFIGEAGLKHSTCPMRGRRAPDLAAGKHKEYLAELVTQSLGRLLVRCEELTQMDRDMVVRDWECARAVIMEVVQIKYAHWAYLPHKFCVLGAIDKCGTSEATARFGLQACLREYALLDESKRSSLWPLAASVLAPSPPLRDEVAAFVEQGVSLKSLPGLRQVAGMVLGVPVAERSIEAKHRLNKLASSRAPHAGGGFVNVHLKLPDFKRRLAADPGLLEHVAADMGRIRTSSERLLQAFGLHAHPTVFSEFAKTGRIKQSTATSVLYRLDSETQQKQHAALKAAFPKGKTDSGGGGHVPDSLNHGLKIASAAALQHLRKTFKREAFYSIALPRDSLPEMESAFSGSRSFGVPGLLPLTDAQYTPPLMLPAAAPAPADGGLDLGPPDGVPPALEPHEHCIFRVVHAKPAMRHIIKPRDSNLTTDDVAVSVHDVVGYDRPGGSTELLVALSGVRFGDAAAPLDGDADADVAIDVGSTRLLHRCHLEALPRLHLDLLEWQPEGQLFYQPKRWPADVPREEYGLASEILTDMVISGAFPGAESSLVAQPPRTLEILEQAGLVDRRAAGDAGDELVCWNMSLACMRDTAAFEKLQQPAPALRSRIGVQDKDKDAFELLLDLQAAGWTGKLLPHGKGEKAETPQPYDPNSAASEKAWYFQAAKKTISTNYLRCLLAGKSVVAHALADKDYAVLLGTARPKRLAIQDDTGCPRPRAPKRQRKAAAPLPLE
ncbi:unnamed protein product, partial [Prorocentrum cordatum]